MKKQIKKQKNSSAVSAVDFEKTAVIFLFTTLKIRKMPQS